MVDLGTGTGAILLSLCNALEHSIGTGFDKSQNAIELARENLRGKICEKRVCFELMDTDGVQFFLQPKTRFDQAWTILNII